mmetsp:Transcript_125599/g.349737  ORF Transcript_125599/g.349737 Transcript_125599/m.349737 type:complete len:201 (-) Transcript_125599:859-1461(-)
MRSRDIELKEVIEVVTILLRVSPEEEYAVATDDCLGARSRGRRVARRRFHQGPRPLLDVVPVDVVLARVLVRAAHEVEAVVPNHHGVAGAWRVRLADLATHLLPGPHVLWHQRARRVLRVAHGTLAPRALGIGSACGHHPVVLAPCELLLRAQLDAMHVVEPTPVETPQDVHASLVDYRPVEGPSRRRDAGGLDLRPVPG